MPINPYEPPNEVNEPMADRDNVTPIWQDILLGLPIWVGLAVAVVVLVTKGHWIR